MDQPPEIDVHTPNIARMYDHLLGGSANFAADRDTVERMREGHPGIDAWARHNRAFLGRAVRYLVADAGIDQFLDLGSGVPTVGNVHEIAQHENPATRVAYVDNEPVAVQHARQLLRDQPRVTITRADIRHPQEVLAAPGIADLLDFDRPIAVLAVAILDLLDLDPTPLLASYRRACVPGSALVVSHSAALAATTPEQQHASAVTAATNTPHHGWRSRDEVAALVAGYTLVSPGVVPSAAWRPDRTPTPEETARSNAYAAVGLLG